MTGIYKVAYKILDHGYLRHVEHWGRGDANEDEAGIIEAARMSTNKGFNGWEADEKLLRFLYEKKHMSPFEMAGMTIELAAPIAVFREWHRHRTQSYNEMSGRYIQLPNENYIPDFDILMERIARGIDTNNRQAAGMTKTMPSGEAVSAWMTRLEQAYDFSQTVYEEGLAIGIPKEVARFPIGVGRYSRMRASGNLRNWLAFLTLRMDPNAQWEIRQYANKVGNIIADCFPRTWNLFEVPV